MLASRRSTRSSVSLDRVERQEQYQSKELATDDGDKTDNHGESLSDSVGSTEVRIAIRRSYWYGQGHRGVTLQGLANLEVATSPWD